MVQCFCSEGIQIFLLHDKLGTGSFAKMNLPNPDFLGPFVGSLKITCSILILLGLLTKLAAIRPIAIMIVAMITTKRKV